MNEDTFDGKTNYCIHENTNESGICDNCLVKPNTQQSTVEERKDKLYEMFAEFEIRPLVADFIKVHKYMESELQLAEQKVREELKQTIILNMQLWGVYL